MVIRSCQIGLHFVDLLTLQLYYKTIINICIKRKKFVKQAFFLLVTVFHLSSTSIKSYLVSIVIAVAVFMLYLAFY